MTATSPCSSYAVLIVPPRTSSQSQTWSQWVASQNELLAWPAINGAYGRPSGVGSVTTVHTVGTSGVVTTIRFPVVATVAEARMSAEEAPTMTLSTPGST